MKILIISHYYKHKNAMASIRPIKLAKYFSALGHDVTVLTSKQKDNWCKQELVPQPTDNICEIYAPEHKGMKYLKKVYSYLSKRGERKIANNRNSQEEEEGQTETKIQKKGIRVRLKAYLSWLFYYGSDRLENYFLYRGLINAARENKLSDYDVVIATYPGAGVHAAGEWIKKNKRAKKFIADYRDPAYNPGARSNKTELKHDKEVQDKAIKYADAVVCVSNGMAEGLIAQYNKDELPPIAVITNGFDREDNRKSKAANLSKDKFHFVYTGALYHGRRTVDMLAKVINRLIDNGVIEIDKLAINYAGPDYNELLDQLRPYGLESIAVDFGYISREESLGLQQESDIVLLLNWNDDNYTGVIPGKLYEYMSSNRPILALIMGNQSGSESARMIEYNGLGCACEQASPDDLKKLESYLIEKFKMFSQGERFNVNSESIKRFEYQNISEQYIKFVEQTFLGV